MNIAFGENSIITVGEEDEVVSHVTGLPKMAETVRTIAFLPAFVGTPARSNAVYIVQRYTLMYAFLAVQIKTQPAAASRKF